MKNTFLKLSVLAGFAAALSFSAVAEEKKEITLKGNGMCARCELKQADSCQNAVQVNFYMEMNPVAKDFHSNICRDVKKVVATGTIKEEDGKRILVPSKIELGEKGGAAKGEEKVLVGEGMCARCELGEEGGCRNVVRVTYLMEKNQTANDFHGNICKGVKKVKATGTFKEVDGKKLFTASKIELVE